MEIVKRIIDFITKNGWSKEDIVYADEEDPDEYEFQSFHKQGNISIDVSSNEIVLLGEEGDICHIQINKDSVYTLLGYLIQHKYLAIDYNM